MDLETGQARCVLPIQSADVDPSGRLLQRRTMGVVSVVSIVALAAASVLLLPALLLKQKR